MGPLVPLKVPMPSNSEDSPHAQSNNSLIAIRESTTDAMVVSWTTLSNTLKATHSCLNTIIHTPPEMEPAVMTNLRDTVPSQDIMMSQETMLELLDQLLLLDQSQLPLRPTREHSNSTRLVSSQDQLAEPNSITVSSLLDTDQRVVSTMPSSRTHGVDHGETRDTSKLPPTTIPAVSSRSHHTQSLEQKSIETIKG